MNEAVKDIIYWARLASVGGPQARVEMQKALDHYDLSPEKAAAAEPSKSNCFFLGFPFEQVRDLLKWIEDRSVREPGRTLVQRVEHIREAARLFAKDRAASEEQSRMQEIAKREVVLQAVEDQEMFQAILARLEKCEQRSTTFNYLVQAAEAEHFRTAYGGRGSITEQQIMPAVRKERERCARLCEILGRRGAVGRSTTALRAVKKCAEEIRTTKGPTS